ncbi:MAG: hypothetical protein UX69_C0006G0002 [candidate division WWE3 bacterium GW2011_GWA2_46_9]|uniref:Methyltransferase n=1 Tax=candidate division WWE3 bacterium GW2011_GWA2_46_9 TaxID=1619111 RepID=A0A0G1QW11_UNCKA|nr:MAG: hypothetical protein UX69_C0006G0002 [candidate division WWE3 bacterium GW2011_GWA2_46_9]
MIDNKPRITSGSAKGKRLEVPKIDGAKSARDVVKLAIFSILGEKGVGAKCLDLYAGSGSFGLEALSRGAESCDFVDDNKIAAQTILKNTNSCGFIEQATVYTQDAIKFVCNTDDRYDIIFIDPFYKEGAHRFLFQNLAEIMNEKAVIVFSHPADTNTESLIEKTPLKVHTQRKFGNAVFTIFCMQ